MPTKLLTATVLFLGLFATAAPAPAPTLGDKVVTFCKSQMGEQVGGGECAHLASAALKSVGINARGAKDSPNAGDYVWGELVYVLDKDPKGATHGKAADIKPGDIIQYRDTKWAGAKRTGKGTYTASAAHHTSVVRAVEDKGKTIQIYQQNSGGKRFVTEGILYLDDLKEGWIRVYRPMAK